MRFEQTVEVVSPEFPCGSAWLANCLFESGVPAWHLWGYDTRNEWTEQQAGRFQYSAGWLPWRQTLASLTPGRIFDFRRGIEARFSHEWPWQVALNRRIVLIVRDPRDALYSEWRRHRRNLQLSASVDFPSFLRQPFFGGPICVVDALWLHLRSWLIYRNALPAKFLLLRFEDWKREPVGELGRVCAWLGIQIENGDLERAVAASDVRKLLSIEDALVAAKPDAPRYNRRGRAEEWRTAWQPEWMLEMGRHWDPVIAALGYEPLPAGRNVEPAFDIVRVLAWRGLSDPVRVNVWRELLQSDDRFVDGVCIDGMVSPG